MEKPTFLVHDFFRTFRAEFKHSVWIGLLDCLLACCVSAACYIYPKLIEQTGSKMFYVLFAITLSVALIVLIMNFYMFLMLVSTNLSLKNVVKNSLALSIVALKRNIVTLLIIAAFVAVLCESEIFDDSPVPPAIFAGFLDRACCGISELSRNSKIHYQPVL